MGDSCGGAPSYVLAGLDKGRGGVLQDVPFLCEDDSANSCDQTVTLAGLRSTASCLAAVETPV